MNNTQGPNSRLVLSMCTYLCRLDVIDKHLNSYQILKEVCALSSIAKYSESKHKEGIWREIKKIKKEVVQETDEKGKVSSQLIHERIIRRRAGSVVSLGTVANLSI
jgi:hypothetical protein